MKDITFSIDDETHRQGRIPVAEMGAAETPLRRRRRLLNEVWADFDERSIGLRSGENLSRGELYEEAMTSGIDEIR